MLGMVPGNHPVVRSDEEIAEDVNIRLDRVIAELHRREEYGNRIPPPLRGSAMMNAFTKALFVASRDASTKQGD